MVVRSAAEADRACWQPLSDKEKQILHRLFRKSRMQSIQSTALSI